MGIKTEDFVKNLPPKEITEGVDWIRILDEFNPKDLEPKFINECARRNPYYTSYRWEQEGLPPLPVDDRLKQSETSLKFARQDLEVCSRRIESEGLTKLTYKYARAALIKAIGSKGAVEYNRREYEQLGEVGRQLQAEEYSHWSQEQKKLTEEAERRYNEAKENGELYDDWVYTASMHEKVIKVRKGVLCSNGRPMTQRNFAQYIGYPISKYVEAEKTDRYGRNPEPESEVEDELLEKLVMICHANPYWLFDDSCEADYADYDKNSDAVQWGDEPCVFETPDVILRWIQEGKPKYTSWENGR